MNQDMESESTTKINPFISSFQKIRSTTELLCAPLKIEDYNAQPITDVSPPKWHLAHTTWFFETLILKVHKKDYKDFNPHYGYLFNSYYQSLGTRVQRMSRGDMTRPTVDEIYQYRHYVNGQMMDLLQNQVQLSDEFISIFTLGLHHEQQHQELLLTDIKYILYQYPLFPLYNASPLPEKIGSVVNLEFIPIHEGLYSIGHSGSDFCFDNEVGVHQVFLHNFEFANRLVNNAEYWEFIKDGGYKQFEFWLSEGWDWVQEHQIEAPLYWCEVEGKWFQFTLNGLQFINEQEPVTHISFYEADAYARWKGMRLLTEFEWETACRLYHPQLTMNDNFLEKKTFHVIAPINQQDYQLLGNTWEWTNSAYLPYPYFKTAKGAVGEYNGKFMINQMVLRGGSVATSSDHIRISYRNFFHPSLRWQFTGIRLARHI